MNKNLPLFSQMPVGSSWLLAVLLVISSLCSVRAIDREAEWSRKALVVVGQVKTVEPAHYPNINDPRTFKAELLVTEVLQGAQDLMGRSFSAYTSNDLDMLGLREICIRPLLKAGDLGVFQIESWGGGRYGQILHGGGAYNDVLPVIKDSPFDRDGSKRTFEAVLQRFRDRRDHPEKYSVPEAAPANAANTKAAPAPPLPEVPELQPPAIKPPEGTQPTTKGDDHGIAEDGSAWWWMGGTLAALGALVLGWLWRHPAKRGGS